MSNGSAFANVPIDSEMISKKLNFKLQFIYKYNRYLRELKYKVYVLDKSELYLSLIQNYKNNVQY